MPFSSTCICLRSLRSSAPSGSSSSSTDGRLTSARASATRCFWPPESSRGRDFSRPCSSTSSSASATRVRISSLSILRRLQPEGDVVGDVQVLEQRVALEDGVHVALVGRHGLDRLALEEDAPLARLLEARDHAQRRGLAATRRARAARRTRPCAISRFRSSTATESPKRLVTPSKRMAEHSVGYSPDESFAHAPSLPSSTPSPLSRRPSRRGSSSASPIDSVEMTSMKVPIALMVGLTPKRICVQMRTGSG